MGLGGLVGAGIGGYFGGPAGAGLGMSLGDSIFGSGSKVSVPASMNKPTDPTKKFIGDDGYMQGKFNLGSYTPEGQTKAMNGLNQLSDMANSASPSPYAQRMLDANQAQTGIQRGQMANQMASGQATQQANMAMKGGLGSGSRERMGSSALQQNMTANQGLNAQSSLNSMNTLAQDEQNKFGLLKNLPSQYMGMANMDIDKRKYDIGNSVQIGQNAYNQQMGAWGANQLARAQAQSANSASKGLLGMFG